MNKIYKIVWNALLGIWVVASELAKGKTKAVRSSRKSIHKHTDSHLSFDKPRAHILAICISLAGLGTLISPSAFAITWKVGDVKELNNAVINSATGDIIQLTNDIVINTNITLSKLTKNVVIDGQGKYGLSSNSQTSYGFTINGGEGEFKLQNMSKIDSANYYGMVTINGSNTDVNVIYDNIQYLGRSQIIFMAANGGATNSLMTFGQIDNDVIVNDRGQEIGEVNKVEYTGRFHVTHTGNTYSFRNSSANNNTAEMIFGPLADVLINRVDGVLTATGNSAWKYTFADGAKFELISSQNVLSGTNNNRGLQIGTYDVNKGFGDGASIILEKTNSGGKITGNAIDNFTTNATGYDIGLKGADDVIFNLGKDTVLVTSTTGVAATKTSGSAGIYIRNAGKIDSGIGVAAIQDGSGELLVNNSGTITSTKAGISVSSKNDKNITVNNTSGTINASAGSGVEVLSNAILNLIGGVIETTGSANAVKISNDTAHKISNVTVNLNGTGDVIGKSNSSVNLDVTFMNTIINIVNRIGFNNLTGLTFAASATGDNTINISGSGTGISTTNNAISALSAGALKINVNGAGIGIAASGGGVDLENKGLNINVNNNKGTALTITDGSSNSTTLGKGVTINATDATAIKFNGTAAKTFTNQGSVLGSVDFSGNTGHTITNSGILGGSLTAKGTGNNTLVLNSGSESRGTIEFGNGNNNVTINNGSTLNSITTGSGDDVFTMNDMKGSDTYLGMLNAGAGNNTLNINRSQSSLNIDTSLQGFNNIFLSENTNLFLVAQNNITTGNIILDNTSQMQFGNAYQGDFSATLAHTAAGDGKINVNSGANVKLTNTATNTFAGTWNIVKDGALTATNGGQLASSSGLAVDGVLNLAGINALNNALTGAGAININANNNAFNFGAKTGASFTGQVNLTNSQFALSGDNTSALTKANLSVNSGAKVSVAAKNQTIGGLTLNGGTTVFNQGSIKTDALSVMGASTIQVESAQNANLLDQSAQSNQKLIDSSVTLSAQDMTKLTLQDLQGQALGQGTTTAIKQQGDNVATGTYNYNLSNVGGGLSTVAKLIKVALVSGKTLTLDTTGSTAKEFTAQITGSGNLVLNANAETLTLNNTNANNDYIGSTTINSGTVVAGSDNALGVTSSLTTKQGSQFNLSGKMQAITGALNNTGTLNIGQGGALTSGTLANVGTVNIGGGTLTLKNGGTSSAVGGLAGSGALQITSGTLEISKANADLTANTTISKGAAITLKDSGTLGTAAVDVGGDLNLNASQTLANILSGSGSINTGSAVTLSGNNTRFTGGHVIGANGQLTVSKAVNLGADTATVNLKAAGAELVLNAVNETINHVLTGVTGTIVSVKGAGATTLGGNNTAFTGNYAVSGGSSLQVGNQNNLGTNATVSLIAANDILKLAGFNGVFTHSVTGLGQLALNNANVTLNGTQKIDNSVGVNIGEGSNLMLSSLTAFNHALTGGGTLNIDAGNQAFAFGTNTGSLFSGKVNLSNSQLTLSGSGSNNSKALTAANLSVNKGATVTVSGGDQTIGTLTLNGGTTAFNKGTITTGTLKVDGATTVQVQPEQRLAGSNLLDQNVESIQKLVNSTTVLSAEDLKILALKDSQGKILDTGTTTDIIQNNTAVATGTYNYGLSSVGGGLSTVAKLVKIALATEKLLTLDTKGSTAKEFAAQITGSGNLALNANAETLTLNNTNNNYTGSTSINSGTVVAGSNNALGATSSLNTLKGTQFNLNGKTQTVSGALTNAGSININGGKLTSGALANTGTVNIGDGTLTLNNGGTSDAVGGLTGNGTLQVTTGTLTVSKANADLTANTSISKDAAITLTDSGTLGSAAVNVGGGLNLNASQTMANILSGVGTINTGSDIILTGNNTSFTGSHNIGANGQLTVSQGANLGADTATVNLNTAGATLVLNAVKETLIQVLSGVTGTTVSVTNQAEAILGADNAGFVGNYAVSDGSSLQIGNISNLGTSASVSLATAADILRLTGYSGTLTNSVTGSGQLALNNAATVTLNSANVADTVGVNIGTGSNLMLSSLTAFNHALTGGGTLNIDAANKAFAFGSNSGSAFGGKVNFGNGQLALSGSNSNNSQALNKASLSINKGATVNVTGGEQTLGGLTLNSGTTTFNNGSIKTSKFDVTADSIIQVQPDQTQTGNTLLDQNIQSTQKLVNSTVVLSKEQLDQLTLQNSQGQALKTGTTLAINQGGNTVATGTYNYNLSGVGGGLSTVSQLVQVALAAGKTLTLDTKDSTAKIFTALITGSGNLALNANAETLTLTRADNSYSGTTTLNSGTVVAGSNNALGKTTGLTTLAKTEFNLNGKTQAIAGALNNAGTLTVGQGGILTSGALTNTGAVNVGGGTLTLTNGGSSSLAGGLTGNGTLQVNGGTLTLSKANAGLAGTTTIADKGAITLTDTGTLGTAAVNVGGALNLNATQTLANVLSGVGNINTEGQAVLSGNNQNFSGTHNLNGAGTLTVGNVNNLGSAKVAVNSDKAALILNALTGTLNNVLSGVAGSHIQVANKSAVTLNANNNGFLGEYAVSGGSLLQASNATNLGTSASVSLATAADILRLTGYSGTLTNSVTGSGQLALNNAATVTLNSANVADTVGVNIGTGSNLMLSSLTAFNHALSGGGTLNIDAANKAFAFGSNSGSGFGGKVNFGNGQLALSGSNSNNSQALNKASLSINKGATVNVTGQDQTIGNLTLNGGTTTFDAGTISTGILDVTGASIVQVQPGQTLTGDTLLDQNVGSREQLINSTTQLTEQQLTQLTLQDLQGHALGGDTTLDINQGGNTVATGTYKYGLSGVGGGLSTVSQLVQVALAAGKTLTLDTKDSTAKIFTALITGSGNLALNANAETLTLTRADNSYSGTTTLNSGTVVAGSNNALGKTTGLTTLAKTEFNLNGKTQAIAGALNNAGTLTVGQGGILTSGALTNTGAVNVGGGTLTSSTLTNTGTVNMGSGTLTLTNGGSSSLAGGLTGNGTLQVNGGTLILSKANAGLAGTTTIADKGAITLTDTGTLGTAAVNVGGALNLNATQTLANVLSGIGTINTGSEIILTGNNTNFTGNHNIGANGQLIVSNTHSLGANSATVNLNTAGATLVLNAVKETLNQVLSGIAGTNVSVTNKAETILGADNAGFAGNYALSDSSSLQIGDVRNLGTSASVSLATATDILKLAGYNGIFANSVTGLGQLALNNAAVTLNSANVADTVGVNIGTGSNLMLSSLTAFNHALSGGGTLNIDAAEQAFAFGTNTGSGFVGKVNFDNGQLALSGSNSNNSQALNKASLSINKGATVNVTGQDQTIGNLTLNGGTTTFDAGTISTGILDVTGASIVQVQPGQTLTGDTLLDQNVGSREQLINSTTQLTEQQLTQLTLQDLQGHALGGDTTLDINQGGNTVATGTYKYGLSGVGGGLSTVSQLVQVALAAGKTLTLDTKDSTAKIFTALITGSGNLALNANAETLTLTRADNSYSGTTTLNSGTVVAGSNNALGKTTGLTTLAKTEFNLNGKTQAVAGALNNAGTLTVGQGGILTSGALTNTGAVNVGGGTLTSSTLTNTGTVNMGSGTLTLTNGGSSSLAGGLTGNGTLQVNGGTLTLSKANAGLAGTTTIADKGAITLTDTGTLGTAAVNVGGALNLNATQTLANVLSGVGNINTEGQAILSGNNQNFSGTHNLNGAGTLTVGNVNNLGSAKVAVNSDKAALILNALTGTLNNVLSGVAGSHIQVANKSAVTLNANNNGFLGEYAVSGGSLLQASNATNLGTSASVSLATAADILRLTGYSGTLTNSVTGSGQLALNNAATVTLNSANVADTVGVNIGTGSNLMLSSLTAFNHALSGGGTLNIDAAEQAFAFGTNTGSGFVGKVNFDNGQLALSGSNSNNSQALNKASLSINKGATVNVTGQDQTIGNLTLNGGTTTFDAGTISTGILDVTGASIVQVQPGQTLTGDTLLDQNVGSREQLINSTTQLTEQQLTQLTLQDLQGHALGGDTTLDINQGGNTVATGTYKYGLSGVGGGLSTVSQLVQVALAAGKTLTLDTKDSTAKIFTALITGSGNLALNANAETLTLTRADNSYSGTTTLNSGTVVAGSNNALGKTTGLTTLAKTEFNLNGKTQAIAGALNNAGTLTVGQGGTLTSTTLANTGTVDIDGGSLTLISGGSSSQEGGLTGNGSLQLNGGNLILSEANKGLAGTTTIDENGTLTLSNNGTLGSAAVNVGGALNLNASQTMANILSGIGTINTGSEIILTGNNTNFTGNHNIGANGQLIVSNTHSLGANSATVNLNTAGATLVLNAVKETLNQVLSGIAGTNVSVTNKAETILGADNAGFAGNYALSDSSSLQIGDVRNLGTSASVSLATATDILKLAGYNGIFANSVTGLGQLALNNAVVTLNSSNVADTVGVNIGTGSNLMLSSLTAFNHALTGDGTLNIDAANKAFAFGSNTGSAFSGKVNLSNSQFALTGNGTINTNALKGAALSINKGAEVSVTAEKQAIGSLTLNGGTTAFNNGSISTEKLSVTDNSIIQVEPDQARTGHLLDQNVESRQSLINSSVQLTNEQLVKLSLQNKQGDTLGDETDLAIRQDNVDVAQGTYNYNLSGLGGGLSTVSQLVKVALLAGQTLTLDTDGSKAKTFTAQITGSGNLALNAVGETLFLKNGSNDYTGTTTINGGTVTANSHNALGKTTGLSTLTGSQFNLNGNNQSINGALTNAGTVTLGQGGNLTSKTLVNSNTVNIDGGTLILNNGGSSTKEGGLTGMGTLQVNGGNLQLSQANAGLSGETVIGESGTITLSDTGTLGSAKVNVDGNLTLNVDQTVGNVLSGAGTINTGGKVTLSGENDFTGTHIIGEQAKLTITEATNLGTTDAKVNLSGVGAELELSGLKGELNNDLIGVSDSVITLGSTSVKLGGNNSAFKGFYALSGSSSLRVENSEQLASDVNILLKGKENILILEGYNETFQNKVMGNGVLSLSKASDVTLDTSQNLGTNVGVDIENDSTLNLSGLNTFNHTLTGGGALNVDTGEQYFTFGTTTGSAFTGQVTLNNTKLDLSGNAEALTNAGLNVNSGSIIDVGNVNSTIDQFSLNTGRVNFSVDRPQTEADGVIKTKKLVLNSGTVALNGSQEWENYSDPTLYQLSILEQDYGNILMMLIDTEKLTGKINKDLKLNVNGEYVETNEQAVSESITQNGEVAAKATYNFGLAAKGRDGDPGLYAKYGLVALELLSNSDKGLLIQTADGKADLREMYSLLTGDGGVVIDATAGALTIENGDNSYSGTTIVKSGELILGDNGVLGNTSLLDINLGATTTLNGHSQDVGTLSNKGTVDITGGTLNLTAGGASSSVNGLTGNGTLQVSGGTLTVSNRNDGLLGNTLIEDGATVTLTDKGNLGNAAVNVDGTLNLTDDQTLTNIFSGEGKINTDGKVTLTGDSTFSGTHNLLSNGALTISSANNLGNVGASVALSQGSTLILSALNGDINNVLSGAADSKVSLINAAQVVLGADNSDFNGTYDVSGKSTLTVSATNQLGTATDVSLVSKEDTLNLDNFHEVFSNIVAGMGTLSLSNASDVTLDTTQQLGADIGINIDGSSNLNLSGLTTFNQILTGKGILNIDADDHVFTFGQTTGNAFAGDVKLSHSQFALSGDNTAALANATLSVGDEATVSVSSDTQTVGGLTLDGGITQFTNGKIAATSFDVNKASVIQVEDDLSLGNNLLEQSYGKKRLLVESQALSLDALDLLTLQNFDGKDLTDAVSRDVIQKGQIVGQGLYNYELSADSGLSATSRLMALALAEGKKLELNTADTKNEALNFTALLTGKGDLQLDATSNNLTLTNSLNSYNGSTNIVGGKVLAGSDNALGLTSSLSTQTDSQFDLNGYSQVISGALNNAGTVTLGQGGTLTSGELTNSQSMSIDGGTLILTKGGTSNIAGGLSGNGNLQVNGGTLVLSKSNADLAGTTTIGDTGTITLSDTGTLGSAAIDVEGKLNLNASQTLANILSGVGTINTDSNITLTGSNAQFTGSHIIDASGKLTVSSAANLGANTATVDLRTAGATLILNAVKETLNQVLSGASETTVNVMNKSATILGADNSGFAGNYAVSGSSSLQISQANNLGTHSSVSLATSLDTLKLAGYRETFSHAVTGYGTLSLTEATNATLDTDQSLGENIGINIDFGSNLNLTDLTAFNQTLMGKGNLNINAGDLAFDFGDKTGGGFGGNVILTNTLFNLNPNNVAALDKATLTLAANSVVNAGNTDNVLNNLNIQGGTLAFEADAPQSKANGTVTVKELDLTSGIVSVTGNASWENTQPVTDPGVSILEQDAGNVLMTLVNAGKVNGNANDLTLSINGTKVSSSNQAILSTITQNGVDTAEATYNYGLTSQNNGQGGLYVKYGLTALKLLNDGAQALILATSGGSANQTLNALLSGTGGISIDASKGALILANGNNSYTGTTTVTTGDLILGASGALGETSTLDIHQGASTSLNGFNQTVGQLNNRGTVDVTNGELKLTEGGISTATNGLKGNGTLIVAGGELAVSATNSNLSGKTLIKDTASVTLTDNGTLGSSNIDISTAGALNLNIAGLNLGNVLSGAGKVNINNATILSGNSSTFIGEHHIGDKASLTISDTNNVGAKEASIYLDNASSSLILNGLSGTINNILYGVKDSLVALTNETKAQLSGNNTDFKGHYTVSGNSALTVTAANNLGSASGVALTGSEDKLVLSGYQGEFVHTVTGNGTLNFTDKADVTFNSDYSVDRSVGMNINTSTSLTLDGLKVFNHALNGNGTLKVNNGGNAFIFGDSIGTAFTGDVNLNNTGFTLTTDHDLLKNAHLTLSKESLVTVSNGKQEVKGLTMNGGTLKFNNIVDNQGQFVSEGTVTASTIDVASGGNIQVVLPTNVTPGLNGEGQSLLELDAGKVIVELAQGAANGAGNELNLLDGNGEKITAGIAADLTNQGASSAAAKGIFDYGLSTGDKRDGLYVTYGLKEIELLAKGDDALKVQALGGNEANYLSSLISGVGDLAIDGLSDDAILSLANGSNSYTGATLVNSGGLKLDASGALGQTSGLAMAGNTSVDINKTTQTVGQLNAALNSKLNLNGGTLTVKEGGELAGSLLGTGQFNLQKGLLAITQANTGFTGNTAIASTASATLNHVTGLGSGAIANQGTLTLDGAEGNFANNLTENGKLQLQNKAAVTLTGNNSQYSGSFITAQGTSITASKAEQLGTANVANEGQFTFNVASDWSFNNQLTGTGDLIKLGAGTLKFVGDAVTAGNTIIENGLIQLGEGTTKAPNEEITGRKVMKAAAASNALKPVDLNSNVTIKQQGALGGFGRVTGNVDNAGRLVMSHALTGDRFADFVINGNYHGQTGSRIIFDTVLAGDNAPTDRLIINGDSSGVGKVYVNNIGGQGGYTNNGIKIIDISGKSDANFELGGRVVAGAYEYKLYQGTASGVKDGDWYLRTENPDRPEAGSYIANLAAANTLFNTSLEDRSGETWYTDAMTGEKKATSMWLRTSGSHNRFRDDSSNKTQDNRFVTQLGGDVLRLSTNANDLWRVGLMAGYGQSHSNTHTNPSGSASKGSAKGYSIGTYGTWFADTETNTGAYVDTWLQYNWFKNEVSGQDLATEKYDSKGFTGSLEGGYTFKVAASENYNVYLQPKAQAIWMGVKADDHKEASNTQISGTGNGNVQTRMGLKAFIAKTPQEKEAQSQLFKPYAELNWVHNSKDFGVEMSHETTGSQTIKQGGAKNVAEMKLGLEGDVTNRLNMWGNVTQQVGGKGYSETSVTFGVKYNF